MEAGFFININLELKFFILCLAFTPYTAKFPFFTFENEITILTAKEFDTYELHDTSLDFNDTSFLMFYCFNPSLLVNVEMKFSPTKTVKVTSNGKTETVNMFRFVFDTDEYMYYKDGKIYVKPTAPAEFNTTLYVYCPKQIFDYGETTMPVRTIPIHYTVSNSRPIYIDNELIRYEYIGSEFSFPTPEEKEGFRFYGYHLVGTDYYYSQYETYTVEKTNEMLKPVYFESSYNEIVYFTVRFYDGKNNLIKTEKVERGNGAHEPPIADRDQYMDGYKFIRWSCDFSSVYYNLDVYGIYAAIDGGETL